MAGDDAETSLGATISDLNAALDEAMWLGCLLSEPRRAIRATFDALTLAAEAPAAQRRVVTLEFGGVTRVAAALHERRGDDHEGVEVSISVAAIEEFVASCGPTSVYGADFFDPSDQLWRRFSSPASLDVQWGDGESGAHVAEFLTGSYLDGVSRSLLLRFWFGDLIVDDEARGVVLDSAEFAADGRRWWDGLHSGDARTSGFGIYSMSPGAIRADE